MTYPVTDRLPRLNVFLSRAGHGSRRGVEALITAGRVAINGEAVRDLGRRVDPEADQVTVDGALARLPRDKRVYASNKPVGVVSSLNGQGQPDLTMMRERSHIEARFHPVGRLDQDSSGLLLWTDDGDLSQDLLRPDRGVWKTYEVGLASSLKWGLERTLTGGKIELDGRKVRKCTLEPAPNGDRRRWTISLHEGRNRQVRRMFAAVDCRVVSLVRTAFGPVELGRLRPGDFRRLTPQEESALRQAAGQGDRDKQSKTDS